MPEPQINEKFTYRIDKQDNIIEVSENWSQFAQDNQAEPATLPPQIYGKPLWKFFADEETRYLYNELVRNVRYSQTPCNVTIQCDSPSCRRTIDIRIIPQPGDQIEFENTVKQIEPREPIHLLEEQPRDPDSLVRICSFCKKIAVDEENWLDLAEGIRALHLMDKNPMPMLTHGVCPECYQRFLIQLEEFKNLQQKN